MAALDNLVGCLPIFPTQYFGSLAFKVLVDGKEMFYLAKDVRLHFCVVVDAAEARVSRRIGKYFFVANTLVEHFEETNRPGKVNATGKCRRIPEDQNV